MNLYLEIQVVLCILSFLLNKKTKIMKKLKEIKQMIDSAQQEWSEISDLDSLYPLSWANVCEQKEKLKDLLEDIRENIEDRLSCSHCRFLVNVCKKFLEKILKISEGLRASYAFPGYVESYYILDTLRLIDGKSDR